ncbi:MAG: hypothetical protein WC845_00610 [Candidatus Staskawiczbacteria bacterium]|jgi:hypothetical protein
MRKSGFFSKVYVVWAVFVITAIFVKDGLSNDDITHILIIIILISSLAIFRLIKPKNNKLFFIFSCVILAALVEGAYMITNPIAPSLLVDKSFTFIQFVHNYAIDLLLTIPFYFLLFWIVWRLINKFYFSIWEYVFLMALSQALGDGNSFFIVQPLALLVVPYVMLNYHAMNVAPFLRIQSCLSDRPRSNSRWKYPVTIFALLFAYLVGGFIIKIVVEVFGLN